MRIVLPTSALLGALWNILAVCLMGGRLSEALSPTWLSAGAVAGVAAGIYTIWSRRRRAGRESVLHGVATYYLGILVYWIGAVTAMRIALCVQHGGWTSFDLHDHLSLILIFLVYGTLWYGVILVPLCFLSRYMLWSIYARRAA